MICSLNLHHHLMLCMCRALQLCSCLRRMLAATSSRMPFGFSMMRVGQSCHLCWWSPPTLQTPPEWLQSPPACEAMPARDSLKWKASTKLRKQSTGSGQQMQRGLRMGAFLVSDTA